MAEKGLKYECKEQDLEKEIQMLLQMNQIHKKIVLIHNGKYISESVIIVAYIDEVWKYKVIFLPSDPYQKAQAMFRADFVNKKVGDVGGRIRTGKRDEIELAKKELIEGLKESENVLGDKPYFGGDTFGFVDISMIPFYSWFYTYEEICNFKVEEECEKLIAWAKRCKQRECVSKSVEKEVYGFVVNL